ncbi:MAG: RagB/SusD family nutrient uptake outer membrane protein, partial [Bacteroidia bacterium]
MKKYVAITLSTALMLGACKKSFLDEKPRAQTPEDYFASSTKAPEEIVTSVYSKLYDWNQHCFSWIGATSIADDNADKGSDPGDSGTDKDQLDQYSFTSTSMSFNELWNANFEGIARVNKALDMLDKLSVDPVLKARYQGEVRFLRAYYYFQLVRLFGGVPVIPRVPVTEDEIRAVSIRNT